MIKKQQKLQISDLWLVCWLYKNRRCKASFTKYNIFQTFPKHFPSWMGIPLGNSPFDRTENALILAEVKSPVSREIWRSVALAVFRRIVVEYASYYGQNRNYNFYPPKNGFPLAYRVRGVLISLHFPDESCWHAYFKRTGLGSPPIYAWQ